MIGESIRRRPRSMGRSSNPYQQFSETLSVPYPCPHCDCKFEKEVGIRAHITQKHAEPQHELCWVCSEMFVSTPELREHIRVQHKDIFRNERGELTIMAGGLRRRPMVGSRSSVPAVPASDVVSLVQYKCPHCSKSYGNEKSLRIHIPRVSLSIRSVKFRITTMLNIF